MPATAAIPHQTDTPQLTPITVSRVFQPEVRGAPQIKGHTRRSLGPNPRTETNTLRKDWKWYISWAQCELYRFFFSSPYCYTSALLMFSLWLNVISTMALLCSRKAEAHFWAWAASDCLCHGCFVLHRASNSSVKAEGGGRIKARVR